MHLSNLRGLEGAYGVNLRNADDSSETLEGSTASLTDLSVPADDHLLSAKHDVRRTFQRVQDGLTAAVEVVKFHLEL